MAKTEGTTSKVMHGARAKVSMGGVPVGIFTQVSYSVQYGAQPLFILGKESAAEIVYTGMDPVSVTATGWRVVSEDDKFHGPHADALVPKLQELLTHQDVEFVIVDRVTSKPVLTVCGIRPTGFQTSFNSRGVQEITVNFLGLVASDETGNQSDAPGAASLY